MRRRKSVIHGGVGATSEGVDGGLVLEVDVLDVLLGEEGLDVDALGGLADEGL